MKKLILFSVIICSTFAIFAQSAVHTWSVDARTALFREGKEVLAAKYPGIDDEHKSSIAVAFVNKIEASYPAKVWTQKTTAEKQKIKTDILAQCYASGNKVNQATKEAGPKTAAPK